MADRRHKLSYDSMVQDALRGVVREALALTATDGLPGAHHFYITFRTRHPHVEISDHLSHRHPEEMTIVLQNQFWGLEVTEDYFEVTLSFNKVNERLHVPFAAVCSFADPSAKFGLQFNVDTAIERPMFAEVAEEIPAKKSARPPKHADDAAAGAGVDAAKGDGAKVITLDAFRKK